MNPASLRANLRDLEPGGIAILNEDGFTEGNLKKAGLDKTVTVVTGDALQTLSRLEDGIDFVFIDAKKEDYFKYFKLIEPKLKPGALIVADNTIKSAKAMPDYLDYVFKNPDYDSVTLRVSSEKGDGMTVTCKVRLGRGPAPARRRPRDPGGLFYSPLSGRRRTSATPWRLTRASSRSSAIPRSLHRQRSRARCGPEIPSSAHAAAIARGSSARLKSPTASDPSSIGLASTSSSSVCRTIRACFPSGSWSTSIASALQRTASVKASSLPISPE
jgi:hypothetical protein